MASLCSAQVVDVVVNLATADGVDADQVLALRKVVDVSSMDNSDLFVAMCLPGTFSPDTEGVCHDCVKCQANQYEKLECIPTRDRTCANCTVCGSNDIELCQCSVKTSQCVTGDRVCLKVPPTVVNLVVDFSSNGVLSNKQQTFVRSGLAVGYTDWLAMQFNVDPETVELTDFVRTGTLTYKAYFRFNEVYGQATIRNIQSQQQDFFQGGILYTFGGGGGRRRLLQVIPVNYVSVNGVESSCNVTQTCTEDFTEFRFDENSTCTGMCWPVPCPPGYSGSAKKCELCRPGTFKAEAAFAECTECPAGYTSPTGANSSDACVALETSPVLLLPPTTTAEISYQNQTTTGQVSSGTSPGVPSSSQPPTSQLPSSSPSAGTTPSPASSSSPPATQAPSTAPPPASSAPPSAAPQTTPAPPAPPAPTSGSPQTTAAPPAPPPAPSGNPSAGTGGSYSSNVNTNNNNINIQPAQVSVSVQPPAVSVNVQPPAVNVYFQQPPAQSQQPAQSPAPPAPPPAQSQPPPAQQPVFNNNIRLEFPKQRMPDAYYYHRHGFYDSADDDWASYLLLIGFAITVFGFSLCAFMGGCPCSYPQGYYEVDRDRPVIRYRLIREDQGSRLVRDSA